MKSKVFKLSHLVLYAKGWYKHTDNVWEDLIKILELDDYTPFNKMDVYSIISGKFQEFEHRSSELKEVLNGIHPNQCWKFGYYTNTCDLVENYKSLPDYDMPTAFIYYVLSSLRFLDNEQCVLQTPKYKLYSRPEHITLKKVIEVFNNRKNK